MVELARRLTGKEVTFMRQAWYQDEDSITIPEGDEEGLFHEILHFIVATDAEAERMQIQESELYDLLFSALVTFECEFL
jgi:hypothetical protein